MNRLAAAFLLSSTPLLATTAPEAAPEAPLACPSTITASDISEAVRSELEGLQVDLTDEAISKIADAVKPKLSGTARPAAEPDPPPKPQLGRRVFDTYEPASVAAQQQDLPLLVSFSMTGCPACFQLKTIKNDPEVVALLSDNYVIANIDARNDPVTTRRFGVRTVPTEIVRYRSREIGRHGVLGSKDSYVTWHRTVLRRRTGVTPQ